MDDLIKIIAILSSVALPIGFGMYLGLVSTRSKHKENMEMIKQGIAPNPDLKQTSLKTKSMPNRYRSLRNGFLCIGIGVGLIISFVLKYNLDLEHMDKMYRMFVTFAPVLIFLGLAYVLFYLFTANKNIEE